MLTLANATLHPSGNPDPSFGDRAVTKQLKTALEHVEVKVVDHFIVTNDSYYSFAERGEL